MTILSKMFFIALLSTGATVVEAEQISGLYTNDCGCLVHLWDVSGYYSSTNGTETEAMTLTMDGNGVISGQGHFNVTDYYDSLYLDGDFTAKGNVKSAGSVTRVSLVFQTGMGTGQVDGYDVVFTMTLNESLEIDEVSRALVGNAKGKLKLSIPAFHKSATQNIPSSLVQANLPNEADGAWGLSLNALPNGTKYGGSAVLHLSNGKDFNLALMGSYSGKKDVSTITLKGTDVKSMNLSLVGSRAFDQLTIQSLKGKLLGQSLKLNH